MSWVKLDDQFFSHPKVLRAGRDARDLYLAGLTYCARYLTNGRIPPEALPLLHQMADLGHAAGVEATLVAVGLWEEVDGEYQVHDYLEYNRSREEELAVKEARAEAGSRGGRASAASKKQANCLNGAENIFKQTPTPSTSTSTSFKGTPTDAIASVAAEAAQRAAEKPDDSVKLERPMKPATSNGKTPPSKEMARPDRAMYSALGRELKRLPQTPSERGRWNKAIQELTGADPPVLPDEIPKLIAIFRDRWGERIECTPTAIAANLGLLRNPTPKLQTDDRTLRIAINQARRDKRKLYCNQCGTQEGYYHSCADGNYHYVPHEFVRKQTADGA